MKHLQPDPKGFKYILIHAGNTDEHTFGCLIVGETQQDLEVKKTVLLVIVVKRWWYMTSSERITAR